MMKHLFAVLILLTASLNAASAPKPDPTAHVFSAQKWAEMLDWITGIQKAGDDAQLENKSLKLELDGAKTSIISLQGNLLSTQTNILGSQQAVIQLQKDIAAVKQWGIDQQTRADKAEEQGRKDADTIKRFHRLCRWLAAIAATLAALYVFQILKPTGLIGKALSVTGPAVQYGAPLAVWVVVFGAVEVWLRYFF